MLRIRTRLDGQSDKDPGIPTRVRSESGCQRRARLPPMEVSFILSDCPTAKVSRSAIVHAETHIPAEPSPPLQDAWVSGSYEDQGRAGGAGATPRQGTKARLGEAGLPRVVALIVARPEASHVPASGGVPARLAPAARLRKHSDFERVYRNGRRIFLSHMTVFFLKQDSGPARVGFTVSRALGGAVVRNRIRRRMREAVRLQLDAAGAAVDIVIHPKKSALTAGFADLTAELARASQKIRSSAVGPWPPARDGATVTPE